MRNLAQRVSTNNCYLVYGSDNDNELLTVRYCLKLCMECGSFLTSSEEQVLDDFTDWYCSINWDRPYSCPEPAWFYCNINEGYNFLVQVAVSCEGAVTDGPLHSSCWRPGRVNMV